MGTRMIEVRDVPPKGRGLFARAPIPAGATIDRAPVAPVATGAVAGTELDAYLFEWNAENEALAFGPLSFANHSAAPNARVESDAEEMVIRLIAERDIAAGEEITFDYAAELWFDPVE